MNKKETNGVKALREDLEQMRMGVVELELKARYWKATHDIRFYTLESEKLKEAYDEHVQKSLEAERRAFEELQSHINSTPELKLEEEDAR